jgi:hypothetical protein
MLTKHKKIRRKTMAQTFAENPRTHMRKDRLYAAIHAPGQKTLAQRRKWYKKVKVK